MAAKRLKHGMRVAQGGERSLIHVDPKLVKRLNELRALLETQPGRREVRTELGARLALICELGMAEVGRQLEREGDLFDTAVMGKLVAYINSLSKLLERWPNPVEEARHVDTLERIDKVLEEARKTDE